MNAVAAWIAGFALVLPWLNPFATGPSSAFLPWLTSLACFCLFILAIHRRQVDVPALLGHTWLAAAIISCAIGLVQYSGWSSLGAPWINATPLGEAFANLRQRNLYATLTSMGLVALVWRVGSESMHSHSCRAVDRGATWTQLPSTLAAIALAIGNALSSSRTGAVQLIMIGGVLWFWGKLTERRVRLMILVVGLTYMCAALFMPRLVGLDPAAAGILARMRGEGLECSSRVTLWGNVLHLIWQRPWSGWGWGELDYAHFMALYPGSRFCDILDNAHNLPLHLAVELGIPVSIVFCALGAWSVLRAKPWREKNPARQMAWSILALIFLHSMLEYPLWYGPFQIAVVLCVWLLWTTRSPLAGNPGTDLRERIVVPSIVAPGMAGVVSIGLVALLLGGASYAAWDYHRVSQIYLAASQRAPAYRDNTFEKVKGSWLFARQVRFAELTTTEVTPYNAATINTMSHELLHFSPEARVVEKLIESAELLGRDDEAKAFLARYQAAFPAAHALWLKTRAPP